MLSKFCPALQKSLKCKVLIYIRKCNYQSEIKFVKVVPWLRPYCLKTSFTGTACKCSQALSFTKDTIYTLELNTWLSCNTEAE